MKIDCSALVKIFKSTKENLLYLFSYWKKIITIFILVLLTFGSISGYVSFSKDSRLENLSDVISDRAFETDFELQYLNIEYNGEEENKKINDFMSEYNPYSDSGNKYFEAVLGINTKLHNTKSIISLRDEELVSVSTIMPKTISIKERKGIYKMESFNLEMYFLDRFPAIYSCFISDVLADKLLIELNLEKYEELIGQPLKYIAFSKEQKREFEMYISNIYYSNRYYAPYLSSMHGEFIIPSFSNYWQFDGQSLSIDFSVSSHRNVDALKILFDKFPLNEFKWTFFDDDGNLDDSLLNEVKEYLIYDGSKKTVEKIICVVAAIAFFVLSIFVISKLNNDIMDNGLEKYLFYIKFISILMLVDFSLLYILFNLLNLKLWIVSSAILCWLLLALFTILFVTIPYIVKKKKEGDAHE